MQEDVRARVRYAVRRLPEIAQEMEDLRRLLHDEPRRDHDQDSVNVLQSLQNLLHSTGQPKPDSSREL